MCNPHRRIFVQLASQLIKEGKNDKALEVLDYCQKVIPSTTVRHDYIYSSSKEMADDYITLGKPEKAEEILEELAKDATEYCRWYLSLDDARFASSYENCVRYFYILDDVCKTMNEIKEPQTGEVSPRGLHYHQTFEQLYKQLEGRVGSN